MSEPSKMINELTMTSDLVSIVARVWRKYYICGKANPGQVAVICFVLIDAEGTKIQASVTQRSEQDRFDQDVNPGKVYEFDTFSVSDNRHTFRATTHRFKLTFGPQTSFYEEQDDATIPLTAYTFTPISEILAIPENKEMGQLIDVYGFVRTMGQLEESRTQSNGTCWLRMILQDDQDNELECILFGDCASDVALAQAEIQDTSVVAVINLGRLTWTDDHRRQVASSYGATQVHFNPKLPEVNALLQSMQERSTPITTQFNQTLPSQRSRISSSGSLDTETVITLDKLSSVEAGKECVVRVELGKLDSMYGWNYDGCAKCSSKPKASNPQDPNSPLYCGLCRKQPNKLEKKMKLTYVVSDETDTASVTFWDKQATQLVNKNVVELKLTLEPVCVKISSLNPL